MLKRGFLLIALAACARGLKGTIDMELPVKDYAIFSEFGFEVRDCVLAPCSHPCPRACQRNSLHSTLAALQRNGTMDLQFEVEDVQDISGPIFLYGLYYGQWELVSPATALFSAHFAITAWDLAGARSCSVNMQQHLTVG